MVPVRRRAIRGYAGADDYVLPARGTLTRLTPLVTWKPIAGRQSYFVLVSKDANFSNIVDYAFTQVPAYSPRSLAGPTDVHGRDDALLLGASPGGEPERKQRRWRPALGRRFELPEAVDAAVGDVAR